MPTPRTVAAVNCRQGRPRLAWENLTTNGVTAGTTLQRATPASGCFFRKLAAVRWAAPVPQPLVGISIWRLTRLELASPMWVWVLPMSNNAIIAEHDPQSGAKVNAEPTGP